MLGGGIESIAWVSLEFDYLELEFSSVALPSSLERDTGERSLGCHE